MASRGIYFTNSAVNSGTAVFLHDATIDITWAAMTNSDPVEGKNNTVEVNHGGFENPHYQVKGQLDLDDSTSNTMTVSLLKQFWKATSTQTTMTIEAGTGDPTFAWTMFDNSTESIKIVITNVTLNLNSGESDNAHIINYDIGLVEDNPS